MKVEQLNYSPNNMNNTHLYHLTIHQVGEKQTQEEPALQFGNLCPKTPYYIIKSLSGCHYHWYQQPDVGFTLKTKKMTNDSKCIKSKT
ncbi:hypothetical protein XELAEV_18027364mg [Xenopus laevis]|uniref:Uncharacterized protein n=1 Tax=Xenopus laevis TaxID=8355 RepID=A0A974HJX0_XENLA|nr:hypothetical protein XELAEV_18027364mg [Xenopus laevis]